VINTYKNKYRPVLQKFRGQTTTYEALANELNVLPGAVANYFRLMPGILEVFGITVEVPTDLYERRGHQHL